MVQELVHVNKQNTHMLCITGHMDFPQKDPVMRKASASDRYLIDFDPKVFAIWDAAINNIIFRVV